MKKVFWALLSAAIISGCATVPQTQTRGSTVNAPNYYVVQRGDTLSTIAQRYGLNYRDIAALNQIDSNYVIYVGQRIRLTGPAVNVRSSGTSSAAAIGVSSNPVTPRVTAPSNPSVQAPSAPVSGAWTRPAKGPVIARYNNALGIKGVRYSGRLGDPIYAARGGEVIYASNGLQEYGNLVLIRHDDDFISAYAHNQNLMVQEKQQVKQGQQIAQLGSSGATMPMLEFQIRKNGLPVDPEPYIGQ